MVKVIKKKSSSSPAAEVVVAGDPSLRSAEKGSKLRRSPDKKKKKSLDKKKKKRIDSNKDTEMVDESSAIHIHQRLSKSEKILPEDSKTLFTGNIACPHDGRKIELADFQKFFQKVGKVVNVSITLDENGRFVKLAEIEFESHDVAKKALKKRHARVFFGSVVHLDVCREGSGPHYYKTDFTYQYHVIYVIYVKFGKDFKSYTFKQELREIFESCGEILWIRALTDGDTGFSTGFAHIAFEDGESFSKALELDGIEFMGAPMQVKRAKVLVTSVTGLNGLPI